MPLPGVKHKLLPGIVPTTGDGYHDAMISIGKKAPSFHAETQEGRTVSLSQFKGRPIVLYFYPRDDTPGCTREACGFRDSWKDFEKTGAVVLGVSPDAVASHQKFATKFKLPFLLLADPDKAICQAYDVWSEKKFMGRTYMGVVRTTFLGACLESKNGVCWDAADPMTRREEGEYPSWVFDRRATRPEGLRRLNPKGAGFFGHLRRWFGSQSPLSGILLPHRLGYGQKPLAQTPFLLSKQALIDSKGKIAHVWTKVKPDIHANEVLDALNALG